MSGNEGKLQSQTAKEVGVADLDSIRVEQQDTGAHLTLLLGKISYASRKVVYRLA